MTKHMSLLNSSVLGSILYDLFRFEKEIYENWSFITTLEVLMHIGYLLVGLL